MIVGSFKNAKEFADFEAKPPSEKKASPNITKPKQELNGNIERPNLQPENKLNLGLNYTINLVLPKTDDPAIFDAIFKSLKENLLNE